MNKLHKNKQEPLDIFKILNNSQSKIRLFIKLKNYEIIINNTHKCRNVLINLPTALHQKHLVQ